MRLSVVFSCIVFLLSSCSRNIFYIVRHAEKAPAVAGMSSDVPLSEAGEKRALVLKEILKNETIHSIYSTPFIRTKSTVQPLGDFKSIPTQLYSPKDTVDQFIAKLKSIKKGTVLIAGHSNTVDDLVNKMMGQTLLTDLQETEYDNLFIIKRKGRKYLFERKKY